MGERVANAYLTISVKTFYYLLYLNDVKDAPKERAKLASEVACLYPLFIRLKYRMDEAKVGDKWYESTRTLLGGSNGPLDQFRNALSDLAGKLVPAAGLKGFGRKLIWTLDKKECMDILAKIERLKTLTGLALQEDTLQVSPDENCLCSWYTVLIVNSELARSIKGDTSGIPALSGRVTEITDGVEEL